jgi:hypothetical protein
VRGGAAWLRGAGSTYYVLRHRRATDEGEARALFAPLFRVETQNEFAPALQWQVTRDQLRELNVRFMEFSQV